MNMCDHWISAHALLLLYQSHYFGGQERCWKSLEVYSSLERSEASEYTEAFSNIVLDRQNNVIRIIIYCNRFPTLPFKSVRDRA